MSEQMNAPMSPESASGGNAQVLSILSLVVGVISLCGFFVPIAGIPLGIAGAVLGFLARKDVKWKTLAIVGIVVSGIGILFSCVSPVGIIAVMRLLGPKIGNTFSTISNSLP
ncbi:MAG: DUF4190 domain-containing protein [Chloroflexi bacterium]|nr:MAG: DUF4190 domain-containing protein [Chloroflexota bacterium]